MTLPRVTNPPLRVNTTVVPRSTKLFTATMGRRTSATSKLTFIGAPFSCTYSTALDPLCTMASPVTERRAHVVPLAASATSGA